MLRIRLPAFLTIKRITSDSINSCLIIYRWATLTHIFILLISKAYIAVSLSRGCFLFFLAFLYILILTFFHSRICQQISQYPTLIGVDLLVCCLFMSCGGGWRNTWYLYSFSPILAGVLFYKTKGGFITAGISSFGYLFSLYVNGYTLGKMIQIGQLDGFISNVFSYFLIAIFFAWPFIFIDHMKQSNESLEKSKKECVKDLLKILTNREIEILRLIAQGTTNKEIAEKLFLAEGTVKRHLYNIFQKLKTRNRAELALKAKEYELDESTPSKFSSADSTKVVDEK